MWFLKPRRTAESVARELVEGLENGTIVLREEDRQAASAQVAPALSEPASALAPMPSQARNGTPEQQPLPRP